MGANGYFPNYQQKFTSGFFLLLADMNKTENPAVKTARKNYKYNSIWIEITMKGIIRTYNLHAVCCKNTYSSIKCVKNPHKSFKEP